MWSETEIIGEEASEGFLTIDSNDRGMGTVFVDKDIQKRYSVIHFFIHGEPNVGVSGIYIMKK